MPKRPRRLTSAKPPKPWREVERIVRRNGIDVQEAKGARKKLMKETSRGKLKTTIHVHNKGAEIEPSWVDQIIDKFNKSESDFYG